MVSLTFLGENFKVGQGGQLEKILPKRLVWKQVLGYRNMKYLIDEGDFKTFVIIVMVIHEKLSLVISDCFLSDAVYLSVCIEGSFAIFKMRNHLDLSL